MYVCIYVCLFVLDESLGHIEEDRTGVREKGGGRRGRRRGERKKKEGTQVEIFLQLLDE
jgi:hypothetical protein